MQNFNFKKAFGQNFLNDKNVLEKIVKCAEIKDNALTIEIGPGSGNLTKFIANISKNVLCYEIDTRLEDILDRELIDYHNIQIIYDDFLKRNLEEDIKDYQYDSLYVISNLPYYITTPIIEKLITSNLPFKCITILIQKEVGDRFTAKVGTKDYNSLTIHLNYHFDIKKEFIISRHLFTPKPNVDSIVVSLKRKETLLDINDYNHFNKLVRDAFKYKRKNLRNNLKGYDLNEINEVLNKYNFDLTVRAEQLSLEIFIHISNSLSSL